MNKRLMACGLVILAVAIQTASAIYVPQTRQEFMKAVASGARGATVETFTVEQRIDSIYRLLKEKSSACLDVKVERTGYVGYVEHTSSDYNPTLKMAGGNKIEFALQVVHRPRAVGENAPPGGLYVMAADIKSLGKDGAEVVLYRPTIGFKNVTKSFKQWVAGEDESCPKMK